MNLNNIPTADLLEELERRKTRKIIPMPDKREPLIFQCETCGRQERAGERGFFADRTLGGFIWHSFCTDRPNQEGKGKMFVASGHFSGM